MAQKVGFQTLIEALQDDEHPFPARFLHQFSDITSQDLNALMDVWPMLSNRRKHSLLEDLEKLVESDTLTNFDDMARELLSDVDPFVRIEAMHMLWESEDKKLVPIYIKFLREDEDAEVRAAAANALGPFLYLGELEKIPSEMHHRIEDALFETMKSEKDLSVRRRALESLGYSSRDEVIPLIEAAYKDKDTDWMVSALYAMGRSSDDRWKKDVLSQLHASDEDIRLEAIQAAGELEIGAARAALLDLLDDEEDPGLRRAVIWSLSKIGGEGVRDKLDELVEMEEDDEEAEFIEEAIENLSFTEDSQFSIFNLSPDGDFGLDDSDESEE